MDCEKFESTLIDELYDELDELTSAASKRHVAGCARCAALFSGLGATRRVAVLDLVEPPAGLEDRILAAAKEAQKVVPLRSRLSRVVSLAGSWAMRPQTAMAAVFLLMMGSSVILVRSHKTAHLDSAASMVVTEQGAPAASTVAQEESDNTMDPAVAAQAHGAIEGPKGYAAAPPPTPTATVAPGQLLAMREDSPATPLDRMIGGGGSAKESESKDGRGEGNARLELATRGKTDVSKSSAGPSDLSPPTAGAPAASPPPMPAAKPVARVEPDGLGTSTSQAVAAPSEPRTNGTDFASGRAQYNAKNYDEAVRIFDGLAAGGDASAGLWAARSVRSSSGCAAAAPRFDHVSARSFGTAVGYDATLEGGQCYRIMGSFDMARNHFARLLTVPSHEARARTELDAMSPPKDAKVRAPSKAAPNSNRTY